MHSKYYIKTVITDKLPSQDKAPLYMATTILQSCYQIINSWYKQCK